MREAFAVETVKFENHENSKVSSISSFEEHSSFDDANDSSPENLKVRGDSKWEDDESPQASERRFGDLRGVDFPPIEEVEETQEI